MSEKKPQTPYAFPDDRFAAYLDNRVVAKAVCSQPHYHSGYELLYFLEGESHIRISGKNYRARTGDLAIYRPNIAHEEEVQPGVFRIICLRFPKEKVELPFPDARELPPVIRLPWQAKFKHILEQIIVEKQGLDPWSEKMTGAYLMQFVVLLWRALSRYQENISESQEEHKDRISRVIDLIYTEINSDVHLKDLAAKAFMSESHFSHTFKDITGVSPKRYVIGAKIEKAQELLVSTDKSAIAISELLGYESPHYFNRLFKKKCGCTPLQYRRKNRTPR